MLGFGATSISAQQEWKTYREPSQFSIDYPVFDNGTPEIITNNTDDIDQTTIISNFTIITIMKNYWGELMDPQEYSIIQKDGLIEHFPQYDVVQDVSTSIFDDRFGYTFLAYNPEINDVISTTIVESDGYIYQFNLHSILDNQTLYDFDKILQSIKFF